jgi:2-polyprenyl-3-methyl-5-hydroxy-6-metoxy-1,4-benzoquinol methylase
MPDFFDNVGRVMKRALSVAVPEAVRARIRPYRKTEISRTRWEQDYAEGKWRYLDNVRQLGHYSLIMGYYMYYRPHSSVLDVGCGHGVLQRRLRALGYTRYVGVDTSQNAVDHAKTEQDDQTAFCCADAESYIPRETFDVIIFNEVVYYFSAPIDAVARLAQSLNPGGIVIISMVQKEGSRVIWRSLARVVRAADAVRVINQDRGIWDVKVFLKTDLHRTNSE